MTFLSDELTKYLKKSSCFTAWKVSKYGVISGPYFPVFSPNTGKYGPEITPYLDTLHAVFILPVYLRIIYKKYGVKSIS